MHTDLFREFSVSPASFISQIGTLLTVGVFFYISVSSSKVEIVQTSRKKKESSSLFFMEL